MAGCNNSNFVKWGYANNGVAQEWVSQYGWTYYGTQDGYRYFTFGNEMFFQPQVSYYDVEVSDGYWDSCGGYASPCDFDPWQDYVDTSTSPSAQMRIWADGFTRPSNQADRHLESPQIGKPNCMGTASGTSSVAITSSFGVSGGGVSADIGASDTINQSFNTDGLCNANSDAYSTYFNLNWDGASQANNFHPTMTHSALDFEAISSTFGADGLFGRTFYMDANMAVNWWNLNTGSNNTYDLFGNFNQGTNTSYSQDLWTY